MAQKEKEVQLFTSQSLKQLLEKKEVLQRTMRFSGEVSPESTQLILKEILEHYEANSNEYIILYISTNGGTSAQGLAFFDMIRLYSSLKLITIASGHCNSAGIPILLAARKEWRFSTRHTQFLIHPTRSTYSNIKLSSSDMDAEHENLKMYDSMYADVIKSNTLIPSGELTELIKTDHRNTVDEALRFGLISAIIE